MAGTLNPSVGDVSLFLPVEQAALAETVAAPGLTAIFSRYNVAGTMAGAIGALASALPAIIAVRIHANIATAERSGFIAYAILALVAATIYWPLTPAIEAEPLMPGARPLAQSRAIVIRLAALFSLDSFGGGLAIQSQQFAIGSASRGRGWRRSLAMSVLLWIVLTPLAAAALGLESLALALLYAQYSLAIDATNPLVSVVVMALMAAFAAYGRYALGPGGLTQGYWKRRHLGREEKLRADSRTRRTSKSPPKGRSRSEV